MRYLRAVIAAALIGVLTGGVPAGLVLLIGDPTAGIAWGGPVSDQMILSLLSILVWLFWFQMVIALGVEILNQARQLRGGHQLIAAPAFSGQQRLARLLVGAVLAAGTASTLASTLPSTLPSNLAGPALAATPAHQPTPTARATTGWATAAPGHNHQAAPRKADADHPRMVTVSRGDSLWRLAEQHLGSGERWRTIADLNRDRELGGGATATDQVLRDRLQPGWQLLMPADATGLPYAHDAAHRNETYQVESGDTLSEIARERLGDPSRWPEIAKASEGITQPDGLRITDPDLIRPGYVVRIPRPAAGEPTVPAPRPEHISPTHQRPPHRDQPPATSSDPTTPRQREHETKTPTQALTEAPTVAPAEPAPTVPAPTAPAASDQAVAEHDSILSAPWVVPSLAGGAVLSAALLLSLRMRRRAQFRARRPGRAIAVPATELAPFEKTMAVAGSPMERSIELLDAALRQLAADIAASGATAPPVAAVELTEQSATLHLTEPTDLPDPWLANPDRLRWTATTSSDVAISPHSAPAPFPLLATVGRDDEGHWWLLNLEHLGTITIAGDADGARDLLRYIAAELTVAPWADAARVDGIGIGAEAARMDPRRTAYHATDSATASATDSATDSVLASALDMIVRAHGLDTDTSTGRSAQVDDELWLARLLLVDAVDTDESTLGRLIDLISDNPDRTGASVILVNRDLAGGFALELSEDGRLRVTQAGLDLTPVGLTQEAAQGCASLLEQSEDLVDVPVPVDEAAVDGWMAYTDTSGGIRREYTVARTVQELTDEPARTMLEADDKTYLETAAVTEDDLEQLAPRIPVNVCEAVQAADPTLDEDFEAWMNQDPTRPRLRLLGPVKLTAYGQQIEVADRRPYYTEMVSYLATKSRHGATAAEVTEAFGISTNRVRVDMNTVRNWLGNNPRTGRPYLPAAPDAPAKRERGKNVYQLDTGPGGLIVDADLLLRMKKAAQARGEAGMDDLRQALVTLVDGVPFSQLRESGWSWILEGDRLDHQMTRAISDAAHILTTHYLKHGDAAKARAVVTVGLTAAPFEDTMQLNLVRVMKAEGNADEAEEVLRDEVFNRSDDGLPPTEVSERTKEIISSWKATG